MPRRLAVPLLLAPLASAAPAGDPPLPRPHLGDLGSARTLARERNLPLVVCVIQEGEEASDRFERTVYRAPAFVEATKGVVLVLANAGRHPEKVVVREGADGRRVEERVCARFETPSCDDHERNWLRIYQELAQDEAMRTPQTIVLLPSGAEARRLADVPPVEQVVDALAAAVRAAGQPVPAEDVDVVKQKLGMAAGLRAGDVPAEAWHAYAEVLALAPDGAFAEEARAGQALAVEGMRRKVDEAWALCEAGRVAEGFGRLWGWRARFAGTPAEEHLAQRVRAAERNDAWEEEIAALKRRVEADALWEEALRARSAGETRAAERLVRRLLRKYADTPAADRARAEFPELARETETPNREDPP